MSTITIPKRMAAQDDLLIVPRKEYEDLLRRCLKKAPEAIALTPTQKRKLAHARKNMARGNYLTINELEHKLGFAR